MKKAWCYLRVGEYKVKVDQEDYARLSERTWRVRKRKDTSKLSIITSERTPEGVKNISIGQFLMKPPKGKLVYPRRYFDGFDYRKDNLIVCTIQERQQMLPKKREDTTSKYRGVSYSRKSKLWRASITLDGRSVNLGDFETENSAALTYNRASKKYFGDRGYQNTIDRSKNRRTLKD